MYIEVDQSGKIEQFGMDTVIALSNGIRYSILIPKKAKQQVYLKRKKEIDNLKLKLFTIGLYYCLKGFIKGDVKTVICMEYTGHDRLIKSDLIDLLRKRNLVIDSENICFNQITKKSGAHKFAIQVYRKQKSPNRILSEQDIEKILW
ncbi:hypothetical protein ACFL0V_04680 [Nanoarchaeota archaeon]